MTAAETLSLLDRLANALATSRATPVERAAIYREIAAALAGAKSPEVKS